MLQNALLVGVFSALSTALAGMASANPAPPVPKSGDCAPPYHAKTSDVVELCGEPENIFWARTPYGYREEWQYGDIYVGFVDGRVEYVLNPRE